MLRCVRRAPRMDCIRSMRAHRGLLKMCNAIEICDGRQALRDMPANKPLRAGHPIYGQLYLHAASLGIYTAWGKYTPEDACTVPRCSARQDTVPSLACPYTCSSQQLLMHLQKMPGLEYLAGTQAYFDDKVHFIEIRWVCSTLCLVGHAQPAASNIAQKQKKQQKLQEHDCADVVRLDILPWALHGCAWWHSHRILTAMLHHAAVHGRSTGISRIRNASTGACAASRTQNWQTTMCR